METSMAIWAISCKIRLLEVWNRWMVVIQFHRSPKIVANAATNWLKKQHLKSKQKRRIFILRANLKRCNHSRRHFSLKNHQLWKVLAKISMKSLKQIKMLWAINLVVDLSLQNHICQKDWAADLRISDRDNLEQNLVVVKRILVNLDSRHNLPYLLEMVMTYLHQGQSKLVVENLRDFIKIDWAQVMQ